MLDFFDSKFMNDLEEGKGVPVVIEMDYLTILILCAGLFVTSLLVVKIAKTM
jgi:hypothetical protein